jgi:hypothetical protein
MRIGFVAVLMMVSIFAEAPQGVQDITYDFLVKTGKTSGYCDHIPCFKLIFSKMRVKCLFEFGMGYSTKYFLDHCDKVISVEFITSSYAPRWMINLLALYETYDHWIPIAYFSDYKGDMSWRCPYKFFGTDGVMKANAYQSKHCKSYSSIDDVYLNELASFIRQLIKYNEMTIALVDPGIYLRGELVQLLFGKCPIIVVNHVNFSMLNVQEDVYGYSRIVVPEDYAEIHLEYGQGTIIWIQKSPQFQELIEAFEGFPSSF